MQININMFSSIPIYEQIVEQIQEQILAGKLVSGEQLPSIRTFANELKVSVITTKNAYEELEKRGYLTTVAQRGSFVSEITKQKQKQIVFDELNRQAKAMIEYALKFNVSKEECEDIIKRIELYC